MINVLIVDDSPTFRLLMRMAIEKDPSIKVIGEARNGEDAIKLAALSRPDIITMDINMPGIGGFGAITQIMEQSPCPIIVLTGLESQDLLDTSFKALALGALTVLPKPVGMTSKNLDITNIINQIKILSVVKVIRRTSKATPDQKSTEWAATSSLLTGKPLPAHLNRDFKLIAIGVSTGGPPALQILLKSLPASLPVPIVIVQHISAGFVEGLAKWLMDTTAYRCKVAELNEELCPGIAYLAPDKHHIEIQADGRVWLSDSPPIGNLRPAAEALFNSVSKNYGPKAIGVILTGMGRDGAGGLLCMRNAGAYTIAQDENSSAIFGMPKEAIKLGAVMEILPLDQIGPRLLLLAGSVA